ncbi:hypothetical protein [Corynebacterium antarcticum]|uniref:hypothetical protein n=1 Tax=Corynebacterium antarcticum TaxID=2800405 RepID=UPI002260DC1D|nr:hypothetical protein [Corynebacterium antarcticum]MCX7540499.1 hypothetical protein [Corynebacterium antarcticum]
MPETGQPVRLAPTVSLHLRRGRNLQFGLDPTWAGIIDTLPPDTTTRIRDVLAGTRTPVTVDELTDYGALLRVPVGVPRVGVLGEDRAADGIRDLVAQYGAEVSGRLPGERPGGFLRTFSPGAPVVLTGAPDELHDLSTPIIQRGGDVIPVTVIDGRVVLGPLRLRGAGPCPLCARLHRFDADPDAPQGGPTVRGRELAAAGSGRAPHRGHDRGRTCSPVRGCDRPAAGAGARPSVRGDGDHRRSAPAHLHRHPVRGPPALPGLLGGRPGMRRSRRTVTGGAGGQSRVPLTMAST